MKFDEFMSCFEPIAEIYTNKLSDKACALYFEILKNYDFNDFKNACVEILQTHVFNTMPKPAEFIEILNGRKNRELEIDKEALNAFEWAEFARNYHGIYKSVCFENRKITQTLINAFGGWIEFCNSNQGYNWDRQNFIKAYKIIANGDFQSANTQFYLQGKFEKERGIDERDYIAVVGKNARDKGIFKISYTEMENKIRQIAKPILNDSKFNAFNQAVKQITQGGEK